MGRYPVYTGADTCDKLSTLTRWNFDTQYLTVLLWHSLTCYLIYSLWESDSDALWHVLSNMLTLTIWFWCSLTCSLWHVLADTLSLTWALWHALSDMLSLTCSIWCVLTPSVLLDVAKCFLRHALTCFLCHDLSTNSHWHTLTCNLRYSEWPNNHGHYDKKQSLTMQGNLPAISTICLGSTSQFTYIHD